ARAVSAMARCCSVRSKSMPRFLLPRLTVKGRGKRRQTRQTHASASGKLRPNGVKRRQSQARERVMAIKYGRPIEAKTHLAPVEARAPVQTSPRLDLAVRPRRNRKADCT